MRVSIDHPTGKVNFSIVTIHGIISTVTIGKVSLAFSYETIVGVRLGYEPWIIHANDWGPTTGKHLNYLNENKGSRLESDEFDSLVTDVFKDMVSP